MVTWIVFLRGINVGGKNILPMAELRTELEQLGCEDVKTYIQSGNIVLRSKVRTAAILQARIGDALEASHGLRVPVLALSRDELEAAVRSHPFVDISSEKSLHVSFLFTKPKHPDLDGLSALATKTEAYHLHGRVFYLHAPDGIGRSKLAAQALKRLGVEGTARNLRTVRKLLEIVAS